MLVVDLQLNSKDMLGDVYSGHSLSGTARAGPKRPTVLSSLPCFPAKLVNTLRPATMLAGKPVRYAERHACNQGLLTHCPAAYRSSTTSHGAPLQCIALLPASLSKMQLWQSSQAEHGMVCLRPRPTVMLRDLPSISSCSDSKTTYEEHRVP